MQQEEELKQVLEEEEKRVSEFRKILADIKKTILDSNIYQSQNPEILNQVKARFSGEIYPMLLPIVRGEAELSSLPNQQFANLFVKIFDPPVSDFLRRRLEYYLDRDFIMFPFTYDTHVINSHSQSDSLESTIFTPRN
jgi:hypothetical protein